MGDLTQNICCVICSIILFICVAGSIAAFIVHFILYPAWPINWIIWGFTIAFTLFGLILIAFLEIHQLRKRAAKDKDTSDVHWVARVLCFACWLFVLALTFVIIAFAVSIQSGSYGDLTTYSLASYANGTQKVLVRDPSRNVLFLETSVNGGNSWTRTPNITRYESEDWVTFVSIPLPSDTEVDIRLVTNNVPATASTFRTPLAPGEAGDIMFSFGSCIYPFWHRTLPQIHNIGQTEPDFLVFLGDFIYADFPRGVWQADRHDYEPFYRQVFSMPEVERWFKTFPTYTMFDDHEIANNYNVGTDDDLNLFKHAMEAWGEYIGRGNPNNYPGKRYFSFQNGEADFFVMDTRTFRTEPYQDDSSMLGSQQTLDLFAWLTASTATFKFICSTGPVTQNIVYDDTWSGGFPDERQRILNFITGNGFSGVLFLSGDDHTAGVYQVSNGIYEFCMSPIDGIGPVLPPDQDTKDPRLFYSDSGRSYRSTVTLSPNAIRPLVSLQYYNKANDEIFSLFLALNRTSGRFYRLDDD